MANWNNGPDIQAAVERAASRLGAHAVAADIEREAEKILSSEWRAIYGSPTSRTPCRVTVDACVASCSSRLTNTLRALLYERVRRVASNLVSAVAAWTDRPAPGPRLHVRLPDSDVLSAGHEPGIESILIHALDRAALDTGIDVVEGPFFSLSNNEDLRLLETLPDLLRSTHSVRPLIAINDADREFFQDALYAVALALLAPGNGHHGAELAVRATSASPAVPFVEEPSIHVTVPAGSGADLKHAGREAYRTGRLAVENLVAASADGPTPCRSGTVLIALSAEHSGNIDRHISAGTVRRDFLSDVPRSAPVDVVVDGYPLGLLPRNRISLPPDTDPTQLAADIGFRLGTRTGSTVLLSTPAVTR